MRIARAPLRITLGGGGTDLPGYYEKYGGFLITAAINKFIYMTISRRPFDKKLWLSYSRLEVCDRAAEVQHDLLRKCLEKYTFSTGIEIHSISDVPGNSGLGSSGAFVVCLLTLLNSLSKKEHTRSEVAEAASAIEMVELDKSCGKQDHYAAALGGIITMDIDSSGKVTVADLNLDRETNRRLQQNLLIYHTGEYREAGGILSQQTAMLKQGNAQAVDRMREIKEIGYRAKSMLVSGDLDGFGRSLHQHWQLKRAIHGDMSNSKLDAIYDVGMAAGALGGKIIGAGGGGFFMFYVPPERQADFHARMQALGLEKMYWTFNFAGCEVVFAN
jgi:D-glycero-alpha-D-manno-heptose-7-phosphate kinase